MTVLPPTSPNPPEPFPRYNVLIVLVDDLGVELLRTYDAINAYPGTASQTLAAGLYASTPNLDAFAAQGITFTNARALPICSPTRSGMYTGRYGMRTGVGALVGLNQVTNSFTELGVTVGSGGLAFERREYTLGEFASAAHYKSGFFGKWHLALFGKDTSIDQTLFHNMIEAGIVPDGQSFTGSGWEHLTDVGRWEHWFTIFRNVNQDPQPYSVDGKQDGSYGVPAAAATGQHVRNGGFYARVKGEGTTRHYNGGANYVEKVKIDEALAWMNDSGGQPFVCMIAMNLIHTPLHDPRPAGYRTRAIYGNLIDTMPAEQAAWPLQMAMLEALDAELGRLIDGIATNIREKTVIIITSDNGTQSTLKEARDVHGRVLGPVYDQLIDAPEARFKGSLYEPGIRVPLYVQGPPDLVRNVPRVSPVLIDVHADVFDTTREIMRIAYPAVATDGRRKDGISFRGVLLSAAQGFAQHARQFAFSHRFGRNGAADDVTARAEIDDYSYVARLAGDGTYKLQRRSGQFELYRILDDQGQTAGADPYELSPLDIQGAAQAQFDTLRNAAEALLATEHDSP